MPRTSNPLFRSHWCYVGQSDQDADADLQWNVIFLVLSHFKETPLRLKELAKLSMADSDGDRKETELALYHPSPPSSSCDEEVAEAIGHNHDDIGSAGADKARTWWDSAAWQRFLVLNFSFDRDADAAGDVEHVEDGKDLQAMAAEVSSTTTLFDPEADDVDVNLGSGACSSSSRSIIIGLDVPRDYLVLTSSSQASSGSDIASRIIDAYLAEDSSVAEDAEMLLPKTFHSVVRSAQNTGEHECRGPRQLDEAYLQPRTLSQEHYGEHQTPASLESPLHRTINDLEAANILVKRRTEKEVAGDGQSSDTAQETCKDITSLIQQLRRIAEHKHKCQSALTEPVALSGSTITRSWMRERLQERWQRRFKPLLCSQLAIMNMERLRSLEAQPTTAATIKQISRQRRFLTREAMQACIDEQLHEVGAHLQSILLQPLRELDELYAFHEAQQYILLRSHYTPLELLQPLSTQHETFRHQTTTHELPLLDAKLSALSSLLDIAQRTCSALETRINRLSAKDVPAGAEREETKHRRLAQPEALLYLGRARLDLLFVRDNASAVLKGMADVERDLAGLIGRGTRLQAAWRGSWYFMTERDQGIGRSKTPR